MGAIVHAAGVDTIYLADDEPIEAGFHELSRQQRPANIPPPIFDPVRVVTQGRLQHTYAETLAIVEWIDRFRVISVRHGIQVVSLAWRFANYACPSGSNPNALLTS